MHIQDAKPFLKRFFFTGQSMELRSAPGLGKSSLVEQVMAELSKDTGHPFGLTICMLSGFDAPDVRGFMVPEKEDGELVARFTRPDWFPQPHNTYVFMNGENLGYVKNVAPEKWKNEHVPEDAVVPKFGVVFFDEFMQADHIVQKPAADALLNGRIGYFQLPRTWPVWAASNRTKDRSGTNRDLAFIQNRRMMIEMEPHFPSWENWAEANGVHPLAISFAKKNPEVVFTGEVPDKDGQFCTPRSLVLGTKMLEAIRPRSMSKQKLPDDTVSFEAMAGWIGEGAATQFMTHLKLADEIPEMEDIVEKPDDTPVPTRPDCQMLLAHMIAHHVTPDTAEPMIKYTRRLPKETQHIVIIGTIRRDPKLLNTSQFAEWAAENKEAINAAYI